MKVTDDMVGVACVRQHGDEAWWLMKEETRASLRERMRAALEAALLQSPDLAELRQAIAAFEHYDAGGQATDPCEGLLVAARAITETSVFRGILIPQDATLEEAANACADHFLRVAPKSWAALREKAKRAGFILVPGPRVRR